MFNDKYFLTQAVLERKKTMTRRIVPYQIIDNALAYKIKHINTKETILHIVLDHASYQVGETVAIAQSYNKIGISPSMYCEVSNEYGGTRDGTFEELAGWENKMFVKAELMPHHIKITNIRVEYLQDISNEDCLKEGILRLHMCYVFQERLKKIYNYILDSPRDAFRILIDKISGKGTWDNNPLVYVYEFELID